METLEDTVDQSAKHAKISSPNEIMEEIFFRLPVKSILRFRSLSKPWLSHISTPSFTKLHLTRAVAAHRTALFFSVYDYETRKQHLLSAAHDGGPVTHLMTIDDASSTDFTQAQHVNGLVFFTCVRHTFKNPLQIVLNPSTHKSFQLPEPPFAKNNTRIAYFFGFHESKNEYKILNIRKLHDRSLEPTTTTMEIRIFSMSSYSWRKIHVKLPAGFSWDDVCYISSFCVNSVVYIMPRGWFDILAFDLRTDKFCVIKTPRGVAPVESHTVRGMTLIIDNRPRIININGCIAVVCHERVLENNEMHIWILQDYENCVWVREIITFPKPWSYFYEPSPSAVNMDEIIFSSSKVFWNQVMSVLIYNKKSKCFKSLQFTLGHQFLCSKALQVNQIKCYVESMVPL